MVSAHDMLGYLIGAALGMVLILLVRAFFIWWSVG